MHFYYVLGFCQTYHIHICFNSYMMQLFINMFVSVLILCCTEVIMKKI